MGKGFCKRTEQVKSARQQQSKPVPMLPMADPLAQPLSLEEQQVLNLLTGNAKLSKKQAMHGLRMIQSGLAELAIDPTGQVVYRLTSKGQVAFDSPVS